MYKRQLKAVPEAVHSLAHITGGGITENLNRALNDRVDAVVEEGTWSVPPIIRYACEAAGLDEEEALKTFNMGLGMILCVDAASVDLVEAELRASGEAVYRVGQVVEGGGVVRYDNGGALFDYER